MDSVLIVSHTQETLGIVSGLLQAQTFSRIVPAPTANDARRTLIDTDFDLVIIDAPLPDEYGKELALYAAEKTDAGIILITPCSCIDDITAEVEDAGIFAIPKPISAELFYQAVKLLNAARRRVQKLETENIKLQNKIEEMRLVDRAKCILIQYLNMTEPQAHRYIEKQAMDLRQSRSSTARTILKTYER